MFCPEGRDVCGLVGQRIMQWRQVEVLEDAKCFGWEAAVKYSL